MLNNVSTENLIEMKGITKQFPGVLALDNVSFSLKSGEVHALMGENGAGKSTLMKILSGIYQKDSGEISLNGASVNPDSPRNAQILGISIIHQELSLMNDLTVAQNIFIGREPRSQFGVLNEKLLNQKTSKIFQRMNLDLSPTTIAGDITIAKQQMVEIAKALSFDSKVLIMDEPTAALNDAEINDLFKIIRDLTAKGVGIIYISHKLDEIKRISNRVTVMRDGQYIDTVSAKETSIEDIISMMVGRDISHETVHVPDLSDQPIVLEVKNLSRGKEIRDVSFSLKKGEILGFAGLMGAGRTEVARALFGADKRDAGDVIVHGKKRHIETPYHGVRAGICYLSEDRKRFGLAGIMSVRENIAMASLENFISPLGIIQENALHQQALKYIDQLAIKTPHDDQEVRLLSGGNQQKVVMAKWLLRNSDILIFDEPTRGIDVGAKSEIYKLLENLAAQGKSIIVISSEMPEVLRLSHRIAVMCEGRLTGILQGGKTSQEEIMRFATQRDQQHQEIAA